MKKLMTALAFAVLASNACAEDAKPTFHPLGSEAGRFVLGQISPYRTDQYLLDTKTGRAWEVVTLTDEKGNPTGKMIFRPVLFMNKDGSDYTLEPPPSNTK